MGHLQAGKAQELALLEEGTLAERGAQQTAQEVQRLQAAAAAEEADASLINTEVETLQVDFGTPSSSGLLQQSYSLS